MSLLYAISNHHVATGERQFRPEHEPSQKKPKKRRKRADIGGASPCSEGSTDFK
jgi:hypothetical protein